MEESDRFIIKKIKKSAIWNEKKTIKYKRKYGKGMQQWRDQKNDNEWLKEITH